MKKKDIAGIAAVVLIVCAILAVILIYGHRNTAAADTGTQMASDVIEFPDRTVTTTEQDGATTTEKTVSVATVQDGLQDMGILITDEYYFTEVVSYSSVKDFLGITIDATKTAYLVGYDGVVTAGVDFAAITVEADDENRIITVRVPAAEIRNVDVDTSSFTLYSEKQSILNQVSVTDFNSSLKELEANAEQKAIEKGILERADENAQKLIRDFVASVADVSDYTVVVTGK